MPVKMANGEVIFVVLLFIFKFSHFQRFFYHLYIVEYHVLFFIFQLEILEGCRVPVRLKNTGEWRKFVALSGDIV